MSSPATSTTPDTAPTTIIQPSRGWIPVDLAELWTYRELAYFLVWRDIKVRYKQTLLGAAWAVLQPFLTMVVFTLFFGNLAGIDPGEVPYPIFSYVGLLPWTFFSQGMGQASNSLVGSSNLLKKVYFPRVFIPTAATLAPLVDFFLAFLVLFGMMAYYQVWPTWGVLWLPAFLALAFATALGIGLWLSALNVEFRDVRYVVPFFVQIWLFVTPVIYPAARVTEKLAELGLPGWLYGLNPMAGVVEGFRWALLGTGDGPGSLLWVSTAVAVFLLVSGVFYFRRMEKTFADRV